MGSWVAVDGIIDVLEDCRSDVLVIAGVNVCEEDSRATIPAVEVDGDGTACGIEIRVAKSELEGAAAAEGAACNDDSGLKIDGTDDGACEEDEPVPRLEVETGRGVIG